MMFGHAAKPSRIYNYGAQEPTEGLDFIKEQFRLAHRYRNKLTEIELQRRAELNELLLKTSPELQKLQTLELEKSEELDNKIDQIRQANAAAKKKQQTPEQCAEIKTIRSELRDIRNQIKPLRKELFADKQLAAKFKKIDDKAHRKLLKARAASELYWGNYLAVEASLSQIRKGRPPKFTRYHEDNDGKISLQLQRGVSMQKALIGDTRVRLELEPQADFSIEQSPIVRRGILHLRIGSQDGKPIWSQIPIYMHRGIPEDCLIKWIFLIRRRIGTQFRWYAQFVLSRDSWSRADDATDGRVGIDVGWRLVSRDDASYLRVAYWVGSDGQAGELVLPAKDLSRWDKADDLRSIQTRAFDAIKAQFWDWIEEQGQNIPDWMKERRVETLPQWRSANRLYAFVRHWKQHRIEGDDTVFETMTGWADQHQHLYDWECFQRRKATNWRDNVYRCFVAMIRRRYKTVVVEDVDWSILARRPRVEDSTAQAGARVYQKTASVGRLVALLKEGVSSLIRVDPAYTTQRCHACGEISAFDAAAELYHTCHHCQTRYDQDENAAKNLLAVPDPDATKNDVVADETAA